MTYVISTKCIGCLDTACVDVCPCDCIIGPVSLDELRAVPAAARGVRFPALQLFIDADECIDAVPVCRSARPAPSTTSATRTPPTCSATRRSSLADRSRRPHSSLPSSPS